MAADGSAWPFAPRTVAFNLGIRACFHPSVGQAQVTLPWLDAAGAPVAAKGYGGPLAAFPDEAEAKGTDRWPEACVRSTEVPLGSFPVTLELVRALQRAVLAVGVETEAQVPATSQSQIHLGPLLLADGHAEEAAEGDSPPAAPDTPRRGRRRESRVVATRTETVKLSGLYKLEVWVSTDMPLLSMEMLQHLQPACFVVETVRNLPNEAHLKDKCEDVYVKVCAQVGTATNGVVAECQPVQSDALPHNRTLRFDTSVVWLLGLVDPHVVREWLQREELLVEVHDRDAKAAPPAESEPGAATGEGEDGKVKLPEPTHPHGVARFKLGPILESRTLRTNLRADVFPARSNKKPRRIEQKATSGGIKAADLFGGNIPSVEKLELAPDYHTSGAVVTVRATLAVPFIPSKELQAKNERAEQEVWEAGEAKDGESNIWLASAEAPAGPCRTKVPLKAGGEIVGPWRRTRDEAEEDERKLLAALGEPLGDGEEQDAEAAEALASQLRSEPSTVEKRHERYGRAVVVFAEDDHESIAQVLTFVRAHNAGLLGLDPMCAAMLTRQFSEEERADRHLDVITGFCVLDGRRRIFVLEGLRERGMRQVLQLVDRNKRPNAQETKQDKHALDHMETFKQLYNTDHPKHAEIHERAKKDHAEKPNVYHQEKFKLLYHQDIGYSDRVYADFGARLKQIKVRMPLEDLAAKPELYSITGRVNDLDFGAMRTPAQLMEIKHMDRFQMVAASAAFPKAEHLNQLNVLYGDYMSDAELEGGSASPPAKTRKMASSPVSPHSTRQSTHNATASNGRSILEGAVATIGPGGEAPGMQTLTQSANSLYAARRRSPSAPSPSRSAPTLPLGAQPLTRRAALDTRNPGFEGTLSMRATESAPDLHSMKNRNKKEVEMRSTLNQEVNDILGRKRGRDRETPWMEGQPVHLYSGQALNSAELQKAWMRDSMGKTDGKHIHTYSQGYSSGNFEITAEGAETGVKSGGGRPNDSYANHPGDQRPPWRAQPARPKESFKQPGRDLGLGRSDDLREAFDEGEWQRLPVGDERSRPIHVSVRFDPSVVPHRRTVSERPFFPGKAGPGGMRGQAFGPKSGFESVHSCGREPGEDRYSEMTAQNIEARAASEAKIRNGRDPTDVRTIMRIHDKSSRHGVTTTDRHEAVLKDAPGRRLRGKGLDGSMPATIRTVEQYHEHGNPSLDFQARLRENDSSAPYDVNTGATIKRDPNVGSKKGCMSGTLGKAPWRHGASPDGATIYPSAHDFNCTRAAAKSITREDFLSKNASRAAMNERDRSQPAFLRPSHYGVSIRMQ